LKNDNLLIVENLKKYFMLGRRLFKKSGFQVKAVDGVDFFVKKGETLGLVGESGCGKTTLGRCVLRLEEPTEGKVIWEGENILEYDQDRMRQARRNLQIVFQDPYSSLDPRKTIGQIIGEGFRVHRLFSKKERKEWVKQIMKTVGLLPDQISRYPHEFSGGQRQRIGVARALLLRPKLIIADEPVSSLDVSIQAQILNLLVHLQKEFQLTYIFISHDLRVVRHISDRVMVMYLGHIVEQAKSTRLFDHPSHPYTEALISAIPLTKPQEERYRILLQGDVPSPIHPPSGCNFHPRCQYRSEICFEKAPETVMVEEEHWVACHFPRR
jgi:oligopeptide/dipeptide ABC transporter ATP-binding protein